MANSVDDIRASVQAKGYALDTEDAQLSMLNSVYRRVCAQRRWWFNEVQGSTTLILSANGNSVFLSGVPNFLYLDAVRIWNGTDYYELEHRPTDEVQELAFGDRETGTPIYWAWSDDHVNFYPYADKNYSISLDYIRNPPKLNNGSDTTIIPDAFQDVLVWGVIKELTFRERDEAGRAIAAEEYNQILQQMRHQDGLEQRQTPSTVVRTGTIEAVNDVYTIGRYGPA